MIERPLNGAPIEQSGSEPPTENPVTSSLEFDDPRRVEIQEALRTKNGDFSFLAASVARAHIGQKLRRPKLAQKNEDTLF